MDKKDTMPVMRDTFGVAVSSEWMKLVGKTGEEAKAVVEKDNPNIRVELVPDANNCLPNNTDEDRVRIYVNAEGKVTRVPCIG